VMGFIRRERKIPTSTRGW